MTHKHTWVNDNIYDKVTQRGKDRGKEDSTRTDMEGESADAACFESTSSWILGETKMSGGRRTTDTAVKAVEGRVEVEAWSQAVHLQKHLSQEQSEEQELCIVWDNKNTFKMQSTSSLPLGVTQPKQSRRRN